MRIQTVGQGLYVLNRLATQFALLPVLFMNLTGCAGKSSSTASVEDAHGATYAIAEGFENKAKAEELLAKGAAFENAAVAVLGEFGDAPEVALSLAGEEGWQNFVSELGAVRDAAFAQIVANVSGPDAGAVTADMGCGGALAGAGLKYRASLLTMIKLAKAFAGGLPSGECKNVGTDSLGRSHTYQCAFADGLNARIYGGAEGSRILFGLELDVPDISKGAKEGGEISSASGKGRYKIELAALVNVVEKTVRMGKNVTQAMNFQQQDTSSVAQNFETMLTSESEYQLKTKARALIENQKVQASVMTGLNKQKTSFAWTRAATGTTSGSTLQVHSSFQQELPAKKTSSLSFKLNGTGMDCTVSL